MSSLHALTFFQISNIAECGLWILLSLVMAIIALRTRGFARRSAWLAMPILTVRYYRK